MIYDSKAVIWTISFIANVFKWTENPSLLEVSVWHKMTDFIDSIDDYKKGLLFPSVNY